MVPFCQHHPYIKPRTNRHFSYVRAIGRISEFRGLYSIHLTEINPIEEPHEIYHHLLSTMVESIMLKKGSPVSLFHTGALTIAY